jgi:hypothetical protein
MRRADETREGRQRLVLLDMAALWMRAAAVGLEKPIVVLSCEIPLVPSEDKT